MCRRELVNRPFVRSDIARLRRVLVHRPSAQSYRVSFAMSDFPANELAIPEDAIRSHEAMERLLVASGIEVVHLRAVLDEAISAASRRNTFEPWLRATYPRLAPYAKDVTAAWLLGEAPDVQYQVDSEGNYRHLIDSLDGGTFVRDMGVMTPRGLIICNFYGLYRRPQARLLRFVADFAPSMAGYPIVFDGLEENLILEGGDFLVLDEKTLLMGTGNRTDPRVAPRLARRLQMDVVAVQMRKTTALRFTPSDGAYTDALRRLFLHLDTCLTQVAERHFVALPYLLEKEHAGKDPFTRFWRGVLSEGTMDEKKIQEVLEYLPEIGRVRQYAAGSGIEDETVRDAKIVDWLRARGYQVTYVGGQLPAEPDLQHFFRTVMLEHEIQAANVVATAPGEILAYAGALGTQASLRQSGVEVKTFPGRDLARWHGGPHCLTLPLERG